jgi:outer membrane immunogenic protein
MMTFSKTSAKAAAATTLLVIASPAFSADLGSPYRSPAAGYAPPPVEYNQPFSWSGLYLGVQLGYGNTKTEAESGPSGGFNQSYSYTGQGWLGGANIGYNIQRGNLVYGLEADLEKSDSTGTGVGTRGFQHDTSIDWQGSVRGRLGLAYDRTLFYGTAGWAFGDVKIDKGFASYSDTRNGWTAGVGLEHMLTNNISAKIEYRYTDFGAGKFGDATLNSIDKSDVNQHAVRAGLNFKF